MCTKPPFGFTIPHKQRGSCLYSRIPALGGRRKRIISSKTSSATQQVKDSLGYMSPPPPPLHIHTQDTALPGGLLSFFLVQCQLACSYSISCLPFPQSLLGPVSLSPLFPLVPCRWLLSLRTLYRAIFHCVQHLSGIALDQWKKTSYRAHQGMFDH